ncbi:MAG TPA: lipopolysaccharide biosynthesis protein RfbH [Pseudomonadales bacterium]
MTSKAEELKAEIQQKVREYYALVHQPEQEKLFVAGESRLGCAGRVFDEAEIVNLVDSALDFWLTYGSYSRKFESALAKAIGIRHAFIVNSGSSANLLAFFTLTSPALGDRRIQRGDEVITVAAGFPTTVAPVVQYGAVPVFVDIGLGDYNIDVSQLDKALSPRSKAVMIAHTLGNPFDIAAVRAFCEKHRLWLVEDNCDALGSLYHGKYTGTFGDIGTSSFYPAHHITTGEGGAVYTRDKHLRKIMLSLLNWGRDCWCDSGKDNTCGMRFEHELGSLPKGYDHKYIYSHFGFNLKPTDMQSAVGLAQLGKLEAFGAARRANFATLYDCLRPLEKHFILPHATPGSDPSWFGFLLTVRDGSPVQRNALVQELEAQNIQTRNLFAGNLIRHPCFDHLRRDVDYRVIGDLPNTEKVMSDTFWVGLYPGLNAEKMRFIGQAIARHVERVA